jgi:hypothetical protein
MANPTSFPGDIVVPGNARISGTITPAMSKANILELAELQQFTIPMSRWREHDDYATPLHDNMTPGTGISTGSGTVCEHSVTRQGGLIKTDIFIDVTGLKSGTDIGDIIGVAAAVNCHLGQITAARNGTIVHGRITCLETPATGDPDIDFYGTVTEATGTQDAAISALTGEVLLLNNGDWTGASVTPIAFTTMPGVGYLYMVDGGGTAAVYTAGQFLIELWGTSATKTLELVGGTHGTGAPSLQTPDFGGNDAAAAYYARGEIQLPAEYVAGQSVEIRVHAGMLTTVADQSATVDIAVYKSDEDGTSTGDLCADAAVSDNMNSLVFADIDFTITPTTLSPGDLLDVQITVTVDDNGDAGVMKGCIGSVQLLCDIR